jgi:hypothetical protein
LILSKKYIKNREISIEKKDRERALRKFIIPFIGRADIGGMITTAVSGMVWQYCTSVLQREDGGGGV